MIIIGAKGLAKELLAVLYWNGEDENVYLFDNVNHDLPGVLFGRFPIIKSWDELERHFAISSPDFLLGVSGAEARAFCARKAVSLGGHLCSLISKSALLGGYGVQLGNGVAILSQATITTDVTIGDGTLVNKNVILSHDAVVGEYCDISPGARVLGRAEVGDRTEVGTNAVILPDVIVGSDCRVGAGAVVTKNVPDGRTVVGVPAREMVRPK